MPLSVDLNEQKPLDLFESLLPFKYKEIVTKVFKLC